MNSVHAPQRRPKPCTPDEKFFDCNAVRASPRQGAQDTVGTGSWETSRLVSGEIVKRCGVGWRSPLRADPTRSANVLEAQRCWQESDSANTVPVLAGQRGRQGSQKPTLKVRESRLLSLGTREANQGPCNSFLSSAVPCGISAKRLVGGFRSSPLLRRRVPAAAAAAPTQFGPWTLNVPRYVRQDGHWWLQSPQDPITSMPIVAPPRLALFPSPRTNTCQKHARLSWALGSL